MKVIFGMNAAAANENYSAYAKVACRTAGRCGYDPYLLYDGTDDPGVDAKVLRVRSRFYDCMKENLRPDELSIAAGAMLRLEIPFAFSDEYVIYADLDTVFHRYVEPPKVRYWGLVREQRGVGHFNSGVSVMNLPILRAVGPWFDKFATTIIKQGKLPSIAWDQGLINLFYDGLIEDIPDEWNWRPYWGANDQAIVTHFHGPKPLDSHDGIIKSYHPSLYPEQFFVDKAKWLDEFNTLDF